MVLFCEWVHGRTHDALSAYERFLKDKLTRLSGVGSIESSFALGQVKYTNVLPV